MLSVDGIVFLAAPPGPGVAHQGGEDAPPPHALLPVAVRVLRGAHRVDMGDLLQRLYREQVEPQLAAVVLPSFFWFHFRFRIVSTGAVGGQNRTLARRRPVLVS